LDKASIELISAVLSLAGSILSFAKAILTRPESSASKAIGLGLLFALGSVGSFYLYWNKIEVVTLATSFYEEHLGPPRYYFPHDILQVKRGQLILVRPGQRHLIRHPTSTSVYFKVQNGQVRYWRGGQERGCRAQFAIYNDAPFGSTSAIEVESCGGTPVLYVERIEKGLTFIPGQ
jgi:hypothetical protein